MTPIRSIHQRALLASLRISSWGGKKHDKAVSESAAAAHNAGAEAGRFSKNLIPSTVKVERTVEKESKKGKRTSKTVVVETNSHKELTAHISATRQWFYDNTLPWSSTGWAMLPVANWQAFTDGVRERQATFDRLLRVFLTEYPKLQADARRILGDMFKESDYPEDVAARFKWALEWDAVPESDFRVALADDEIKALTANAEGRIMASVQAAQDDAVKRLYESLQRIHSTLSKTRVSSRKHDAGEIIGTTYRDTLVTNAREVCDILSRLNVADDPKLESFRRETELLASVEPDTLRDNADIAKETATRAQDILDAMTQTYGASLFKTPSSRGTTATK